MPSLIDDSRVEPAQKISSRSGWIQARSGRVGLYEKNPYGIGDIDQLTLRILTSGIYCWQSIKSSILLLEAKRKMCKLNFAAQTKSSSYNACIEWLMDGGLANEKFLKNLQN